MKNVLQVRIIFGRYAVCIEALSFVLFKKKFYIIIIIDCVLQKERACFVRRKLVD